VIFSKLKAACLLCRYQRDYRIGQNVTSTDVARARSDSVIIWDVITLATYARQRIVQRQWPEAICSLTWQHLQCRLITYTGRWSAPRLSVYLLIGLLWDSLASRRQNKLRCETNEKKKIRRGTSELSRYWVWPCHIVHKLSAVRRSRISCIPRDLRENTVLKQQQQS